MQELKQPTETPRGPMTHVSCPVEIRIFQDDEGTHSQR